MTFLIILGVREILCNFRLVLEGKTRKEIPETSRLEFLEKFSAKYFALSDAEENPSQPLNRGGKADLASRTLFSNSPKVPRAMFLGNDGLFCFISICKFASFKSSFETTTSLSEFSY